MAGWTSRAFTTPASLAAARYCSVVARDFTAGGGEPFTYGPSADHTCKWESNTGIFSEEDAEASEK